MDKCFVADTNILLDHLEEIQDYKIVLLSSTLRELEKHKSSNNEDLKYRAREISRHIKKNLDRFHFDTKDYDGSLLGKDYDNSYQDNNILKACVDNNYGLITGDVLLQYKARGFNLDVIDLDNMESDSDDYKGFVEVYMTNEEYTEFYQNRLDSNEFKLISNQYLIIKDDFTGNVLDALKFDGKYYITVKTKGFSTKMFGSFKPYDHHQACVLDSLQSNQLTMIKGKAGSGKSLIALSYAMQQLERNKIDKLICFVNPVASRNSAKLGFYPGTRDEKILDSAVGSMLASKFGDKFQVEAMIASGQLLLLPFSDIRGFDTTGMNAIVYIIEAQNLDVDLMKLAIQRVGDDSKLIIDGDYSSQVDDRSYEGRNNGMRRVSEIFRGEDYYGEVELSTIYRSKLASKADEM